MTDETALKLAEAMNRLAAAIEKIGTEGQAMVPAGVHIWHHQIPSGAGGGPQYCPQSIPYQPSTTGPGYPAWATYGGRGT